MNARSVSELGECVLRAMKDRRTPHGIAMAVEAEVVEPLRARVAAFESLRLGDPATLCSHQCSNPAHPVWLSARTDRRGCPWCRLAELERMQQPTARTVFLADYDGADDGPKLFASLQAAQAWVAEWSTGDAPWDWFEQDGVWEQWTCDRDSDRPTSKGAGIVTPLELGAAASVVWRAEYPEGALTLGHYTGRDAAMAHVHQVLADEENTTPEAIALRVMWRADDPHGPEGEPTAWECWLVDEDGEDDKPTGYVVTPVEVAAAYDADGES